MSESLEAALPEPMDGLVAKERTEIWEFVSKTGQILPDETDAWAKKKIVNGDLETYFILTANGDLEEKDAVRLSNPIMKFKRVSQKTYTAFTSYLKHSTPHAFTNARQTFLLHG